jgi:hypothetical protein
MEKGGMSTERVDAFLYSETVEMATKIMKAVAVHDITGGMGPASVDRLHNMLAAVKSVTRPRMKPEVEVCLALILPLSAPIELLGRALDDIALDQPPALLASYTGCPPGKALIKKACIAYEARNNDKQGLALIKHGEQLLAASEKENALENPDALLEQSTA